MKQLIIRGGKPLHGDVYISGMKNSALPVIFGTIAANDVCTIKNLPDVSDISLALETLEMIGADVRFIDTSTAIIDTRRVQMKSPPLEYVSKMRGSIYLLGAMLGRFGKAQVGYPGGCDFGLRPINLHIKGFEALGARISFSGSAMIDGDAPDGLRGNLVYLDIASVGATINIMLAAVFADGTTIIENAAREPHIVDMACFLNACGAKISGAGTSMIRIKGVDKLHGCTYELAPDMIEAGTYMVAAAATGGRICVKNVVPKHMESISAKLREIGIPLEMTENSITVNGVPSFRGTEIRTNPYPGFPTDMHPQFSALLALSQGMSTVSEGIYSGRFKYVPELNRMGAHIEVVDNAALINGVEELHGAEVKATDLRAGACLVIAALAAHGVTTISGVECIDRGYENLVEKLKFLGANIKRT